MSDTDKELIRCPRCDGRGEYLCCNGFVERCNECIGAGRAWWPRVGTKALATLEFELRQVRGESEGDDKALVRRVLGYMEKARAELEKAIGAAALNSRK